jgi:hypothetical protein
MDTVPPMAFAEAASDAAAGLTVRRPVPTPTAVLAAASHATEESLPLATASGLVLAGGSAAQREARRLGVGPAAASMRRLRAERWRVGRLEGALEAGLRAEHGLDPALPAAGIEAGPAVGPARGS